MKSTVALILFIGLVAGSPLAWGQEGAHMQPMQHMQQMAPGAATEMPRRPAGPRIHENSSAYPSPCKSTCLATCAIILSL